MQALKQNISRIVLFVVLALSLTTASPITISQLESHFGGKIVQKFGDAIWLNPDKKSTRVFISMAYDSKVRSLFDGPIIRSGYRPEFSGLSVQVQMPNGDILTYGCLSRISASKDQRLRKGQLLGFSGGDGDKCGGSPGISLYLLRNGVRKDPMQLNFP